MTNVRNEQRCEIRLKAGEQGRKRRHRANAYDDDVSKLKCRLTALRELAKKRQEPGLNELEMALNAQELATSGELTRTA
ncbi:hypothetical protein Tco_1353584 [Tanacetum coccineum]